MNLNESDRTQNEFYSSTEVNYVQEYMVKCRQYDELQRSFDEMTVRCQAEKAEAELYKKDIEEYREKIEYLCKEIGYLKAIIKAFELGFGKQILEG